MVVCCSRCLFWWLLLLIPLNQLVVGVIWPGVICSTCGHMRLEVIHSTGSPQPKQTRLRRQIGSQITPPPVNESLIPPCVPSVDIWRFTLYICGVGVILARAWAPKWAPLLLEPTYLLPQLFRRCLAVARVRISPWPGV